MLDKKSMALNNLTEYNLGRHTKPFTFGSQPHF